MVTACQEEKHTVIDSFALEGWVQGYNNEGADKNKGMFANPLIAYYVLACLAGP